MLLNAKDMSWIRSDQSLFYTEYHFVQFWAKEVGCTSICEPFLPRVLADSETRWSKSNDGMNGHSFALNNMPPNLLNISKFDAVLKELSRQIAKSMRDILLGRRVKHTHLSNQCVFQNRQKLDVEFQSTDWDPVWNLVSVWFRQTWQMGNGMCLLENHLKVASVVSLLSRATHSTSAPGLGNQMPATRSDVRLTGRLGPSLFPGLNDMVAE